MSTALSLHVGLNSVWSVAYNHWPGLSTTGENDANAMRALAESEGFTATSLLTADATCSNVRDEVLRASGILKPGDFFLLTASLHGFQRLPQNVATWALYDQEMIDAEVTGLVKGFASGVRVLVVAESCRSGGIFKPPPGGGRVLRSISTFISTLFEFNDPETYRVPFSVIDFLAKSHATAYIETEAKYRKVNLKPTSDQVILFAACQPGQDASIEGDHGLFTNRLLAIWNEAHFTGNYQDFFDSIEASMPMRSIQDPILQPYGTSVAAFLVEKPFTI